MRTLSKRPRGWATAMSLGIGPRMWARMFRERLPRSLQYASSHLFGGVRAIGYELAFVPLVVLRPNSFQWVSTNWPRLLERARPIQNSSW